jgi:hypothetical protein
VPKVSPRESFCLGLHLPLALAKHLPIFKGSSQFYGVIFDLSHTRDVLEMQENRPASYLGKAQAASLISET